MTPLRVATRGSELARWQAERVASLVGSNHELVIVETTGDRRADEPLHSMGGAGVFVKEVQAAVLDGRADIAVHSAKDLPADPVDGLVLAAFPERTDARDALVGATLDGLVTGARVGTDSVRRRAQLAFARPDLTFGPLRGNIATRLEKAAGYDAVVIAACALDRLGLADRATERLAPSVMLPQVGQGALAVECRADDAKSIAAVTAIDDAVVRRVIETERAFLAEMGGGCSLPVGALATVEGDTIHVEGLLASLDGRVTLRAVVRGHESAPLGAELARTLLDERGGRALLEDVA